jgi:hypothetical protein
VHRTEFVPQTEHSGLRAGDVSEDGHVLNIEEPALFNETLERSWRWRKRIDGRRAILPRGVLEDGATASVRRVGSIRAVEGRGAMTSPLDAFAEAAAYESWVSGRVSCRLQRALPASRMAQISEKALF